VKKAFSAIATAGLIVMIYTMVLSYKLERGTFPTQEIYTSTFTRYKHVWDVAMLLSLCGYIGLAVNLDSRKALERAGTALFVSAALVVFVFVIPIVNKEDWSGAAFETILALIFCYGVTFLIVGLLRMAWVRFLERKNVSAN
jgi:hypothetical protein